jgi:hypothetical protein
MSVTEINKHPNQWDVQNSKDSTWQISVFKSTALSNMIKTCSFSTAASSKYSEVLHFLEHAWTELSALISALLSLSSSLHHNLPFSFCEILSIRVVDLFNRPLRVPILPLEWRIEFELSSQFGLRYTTAELLQSNCWNSQDRLRCLARTNYSTRTSN